MLSQLSIEGYRSIRSLSLDLGRLTVIEGSNGVGKTNVYRALVLLQAATRGTFARLLAEEGGIPSVVFAGPRKKNEPVRMGLSVRFDDFEYELLCGPEPFVPKEPPHFALDPELKSETMWVRDGGARHVVLERKSGAVFARDADGRRQLLTATLLPSESVLSQVSEPQRFPLLAAAQQQFGSWRFYHHFSTGLGAPVREPQVATRTPVLSDDGHDLAAALQNDSCHRRQRATGRGRCRGSPGSAFRGGAGRTAGASASPGAVAAIAERARTL